MQIARLAHSKSTTKNAMLHFSSEQRPYSGTAEPDPFVALFTDPATRNKVGVVLGEEFVQIEALCRVYQLCEGRGERHQWR
jgi:hypothetical protein